MHLSHGSSIDYMSRLKYHECRIYFSYSAHDHGQHGSSVLQQLHGKGHNSTWILMRSKLRRNIYIAFFFKVESSENEKRMENCLRLACLLGGDTDTIASMACALVGAHVGLNSHILFLLSKCENHHEPLDLGQQIYDLVYPSIS